MAERREGGGRQEAGGRRQEAGSGGGKHVLRGRRNFRPLRSDTHGSVEQFLSQHGGIPGDHYWSEQASQGVRWEDEAMVMGDAAALKEAQVPQLMSKSKQAEQEVVKGKAADLRSTLSRKRGRVEESEMKSEAKSEEGEDKQSR